MKSNINIEITLKGDLVAGIAETLTLAKSLKSDLFLTLWPGKCIRIGHESNVQDLIDIAILEQELRKFKEVKSC